MIGLFIGSFNPPTLAHLNICLKLENEFSKIIFIPVNTKDKNLVSILHRINMLKIYKKKYHFLDVDNIMYNYSYFDYRILDLLNMKYRDIKIIIGSDILDKLYKFDNKKYLLENFNYVVIKRDNDVENIINSKYKKYKNHFEICDFESQISSTKVRELIKNNKSTKNIIDKDINDYIINNNLYF